MAFLFLFSLSSCKEKGKEKPRMSFNSSQWQHFENGKYPFRALMLDEVIFNDSIRALNSSELKLLLGPPTKQTEAHLYYRIDDNKLGHWNLNARTMVIKMDTMDKVEWIKIHG